MKPLPVGARVSWTEEGQEVCKSVYFRDDDGRMDFHNRYYRMPDRKREGTIVAYTDCRKMPGWGGPTDVPTWQYIVLPDDGMGTSLEEFAPWVLDGATEEASTFLVHETKVVVVTRQELGLHA